MHLFADENIQQLTVLLLRESGYDVRWVPEEGLGGAADDVVFKRAQELNRALLTYDADFADLRILSGQSHHGVIRLRVRNQRISFMHPILLAALSRLKDIEIRDTLITVTDDCVRVRRSRRA